MSGTERTHFNVDKEDKEMYLFLFQSRDCLNVEPGPRILGLQMLVLNLLPVQKTLSSLVPHLIFS